MMGAPTGLAGRNGAFEKKVLGSPKRSGAWLANERERASGVVAALQGEA
jgi:hypothetical protein